MTEAELDIGDSARTFMMSESEDVLHLEVGLCSCVSLSVLACFRWLISYLITIMILLIIMIIIIIIK